MTRTVGAFEAKTHLSQLLDAVQQGQEVVITRHGQAVARLLPSQPGGEQRRQEAIARLRSFRVGKRLGDLSIQELRDQGRKR
jgi:prevent-host-death family protein